MDDSNADYLTKYREFIDSLLKTTDLDYPLPVSVAKYNIAEFEITGEILNWCLTYLNERNCPNSLAAPLCCKVLEEILQLAKENPESCGYRTYEDDFQPLKLMQKTIKKLVDVCIYYTDNAKLSTLLPPPTATLLDPPVSVCGVKNSRRKMEDRHVAIQDLHALFNIKDCGSASYYAVFDGHNGMDAAAYSSCHVHQYIVESSHYPHNPESALREAFKKTDDRFVDKSNKENLDSGTTALCALLRPNESMLYVAWLGDSQAVLVSQGKAYQLVKPHRPDQPDERQRINDMGGTVLYLGSWRVNGHLAVSRAIGDRKYKPFVVGEPDVRVIPLTGKEEFLILASDGLWDYVPENEVVNAVYNYLQNHKGDVGGISKHLVQLAKNQFSRDNISVVVVFLSEPEPYKGGRMEASEVEHIWRDTSYVTKTSNGQFNHDDDFGPETNVDGHDVLTPSFAADAAKAKALVVQSQALEEETGNDVVEAEVEDGSEDESEDEWNYVSGKNNKKPDKKPQVEAVERSDDQRQGEDEIDDDDDMSRLNPDAAPFVPVFDEKLDKVLASSPAKGTEKSLEDVHVPQPNDFFDDIASKPSDLESLGYEVNLNETSVNGIDLTVDSTKAECGDDISDEDLGVSPTHPSSNPFSDDTIQHQMMSDYFGDNRNLGFKPFDPMQESMVVLDSTPSPSAPSGDLCDYGQNDKPDLLSPIGTLTTPNDQQTPSSGFESETGADELVPKKCDLVAEIPRDSQHFAGSMENQFDDVIDTNPFSMQQISNSFDPTGFFNKPCEKTHDLDIVQEENSLEEVGDVSQNPAQTVDHVDLISGMASESSFNAQDVDNVPRVDFDTLPPDVAQFSPVDIVVQSEDNQNDVESEEITPCDEQKEQALLVVEDKSKEESGDSDGFEIISKDDAEIEHCAMNGIHLNDDSPDNYKVNDFVQHSVQIHEAPKSFEEPATDVRHEDFFGSTGYRPELDVSAVESVPEEPPNTFLVSFEDSKAQQPDVPEIHQEVQEAEIHHTEIQHDDFDDVFAKSSFGAVAADIGHNVEEITSQVEDLTLEERIPPAVSAEEEVLAKSEPEIVESECAELYSYSTDADLRLPEPKGETIAETKVTEELSAAAAESLLTEDLPAAPSTLVVEEQPEKDELAASELVTPAEKSLDSPVEPEALEQVEKTLESPVELSEEASEEISSELPIQDFGKQNGHIADVSTPPSTPAPGVQTDETNDALIAAAVVAAAGAATVAAVASKAEEKIEKKPAPGKTTAKPTAAKAPAKPAAGAASARKPTTTTTTKAPVTTAKAAPAKPAGVARAAPAKPAAAKPASPVTKTAAASTTRPKPAAATAPKPATSTAARPAAPKPLGVAAKPATTAAAKTTSTAKAPLAKPKTPTTTPAPIKKPTTTTVTKTTTMTTTSAKKPEPAKSLAAKVPAKTTSTTARPTSATKPTSATSTTRPSSATKPAAKPLTATTRTSTVKTTTTTTTKPAVPKAPSTATKAPAKPPTPISKAAPASKAAPPKPKPAAPTVLKKSAPAAAADKNKPPTKPAPIRKPADKTKPADKEVKEIIEPPMQEPIVSTTNGHIENGILSDESPIDIDSRPVVEAQN